MWGIGGRGMGMGCGGAGNREGTIWEGWWRGEVEEGGGEGGEVMRWTMGEHGRMGGGQ